MPTGKDPYIKEFVATALLGFEKPIEEELLHWYRQVPVTANTDVSVSLDGAMDRITWRTEGMWDTTFDPMIDYLRNFNFGQKAASLFDNMVAELEPERIGSFISARSNVFELGWYTPDLMSIDVLLGMARFAEKNLLRQWAETYGVTQVCGIGASLDSASLIMECTIPITSNTTTGPLETGLLLFRYLGLPYPADELLSVLTGQRDAPAAVSLWFTEEDIVKVGLLLKKPAAETVVGAGTVLDLDLKKLAVFEAALDSNGPLELEVALYGTEDFQLVFHYRNKI